MKTDDCRQELRGRPRKSGISDIEGRPPGANAILTKEAIRTRRILYWLTVLGVLLPLVLFWISR